MDENNNMHGMVTIKIALGNDAMRTGANLVGLLRDLAETLELSPDADVPSPRLVVLRDANGNRVGQYVRECD